MGGVEGEGGGGGEGVEEEEGVFCWFVDKGVGDVGGGGGGEHFDGVCVKCVLIGTGLLLWGAVWCFRAWLRKKEKKLVVDSFAFGPDLVSG